MDIYLEYFTALGHPETPCFCLSQEYPVDGMVGGVEGVSSALPRIVCALLAESPPSELSFLISTMTGLDCVIFETLSRPLCERLII